jgi:hypothetical protein
LVAADCRRLSPGCFGRFAHHPGSPLRHIVMIAGRVSDAKHDPLSVLLTSISLFQIAFGPCTKPLGVQQRLHPDDYHRRNMAHMGFKSQGRRKIKSKNPSPSRQHGIWNYRWASSLSSWQMCCPGVNRLRLHCPKWNSHADCDKPLPRFQQMMRVNASRRPRQPYRSTLTFIFPENMWLVCYIVPLGR